MSHAWQIRLAGPDMTAHRTPQVWKIQKRHKVVHNTLQKIKSMMYVGKRAVFANSPVIATQRNMPLLHAHSKELQWGGGGNEIQGNSVA